MDNLNESGKIYFFKTSQSETPSEAFGPLLEVNSNFDILKSLNIYGAKALGITSNNELLEWEFDSKQQNQSNTKSKVQKKKDFNFLTFKPSYQFHKIKFIQITLNKTLCLGLDTYHNVLVWGQSKEGLLGLGYEITSVETPTLIPKLKEIKEVSLSEYHAVALNINGNAFSWGLGKYGELGLERSIYTPSPQQILTETVYSKVFCGNLITCFIDENGKFYYFGVIIKQLSGYGNIVTIKNLLNDQSFQDGKNIYFEKEIEELENEYFKNIVIGNGFVSLLSKNGLLYVLEYNNKLTMLYSKYFLYNITVANNDIYGLARERPKIDKNKKDNYYLFKWSSKYSSENDLYSDLWSTTIWKFKSEFNLISNSKLLETNNNKNILLLKDQDEKYNLTNSIFNPHRKNLEIFSQNNDNIHSLEKSVNNPNIPSLGDFTINKKILPEKFLEYNNTYDDSYNIKYKKCKLKLNIKTGIENSSINLNNNINNNKSRTINNQNFSNNNNLFSESYNAQIDLGKENDNVNIYKPEEEDEILDAKEKELNKYRNEVDNIINNFKAKKDLTNSSINNNKKNQMIYTSRDNEKHKENNMKYISQNNSNQNERYSSSENNYFNINQEEGNNIERIKLKLSKEDLINLNKSKNKEKENISNYNDSLSRVRNNIISIKDKIKFRNNDLIKLNKLFTLSEEEDEEEEEQLSNSNKNKEGNNNIKNNSINKKRKEKRKQMIKKFMRSPSFSVLKTYNKKNKNNFLNILKKDRNENGSEEDDFVNIEDLGASFKRKRFNSKDNIFLDKKNDNNKNNEYETLGMKYISGNNSENGNLNMKNSKKNLINDENNNENNSDFSKEENNELINKKKGLRNNKDNKKKNNNDKYEIKKRSKNKKLNKINNNDKNQNNEESSDEEEFEENEDEEEEIEFFDEINKENKKIRKIKKVKGKIKIRFKRSNSMKNKDLIEIIGPNESDLLPFSLKEINIKSKNNIRFNSLDKIDKRKSISNVLISQSNLNKKKKKKKFKRNINNKNNREEEEINEEEEEEEDDDNADDNINRIRKINKNKKSKKIKNKNNLIDNDNKNQDENESSNNNNEKNDYDDKNNEITFKKKVNSYKQKIIDNKKQLNTGKINIIKKNKIKDENSKNSSNDELYNKIKYFQMHSYGIKINKFSLMYFCDLIEHYMKKKSFALCARQIANYQKYLEIKFSLKILFRVLLKRIIFYKLKFMHRYKKINKYLIKNKIKNIKYVYKKKK